MIDITHNVTDFTTYKIEAYVKQTTGSNKTINCMWESMDYAGAMAYTTVQNVVAPNGTWTKVDATVVAPGDVSKLSLYFEMANYSNDFYVDNISITEKHLDMDAVLAAPSRKRHMQTASRWDVQFTTIICRIRRFYHLLNIITVRLHLQMS